MLGEVTDNLAAVTAGLDERRVTLRAYFLQNPSEEDKESIECAATDLIADYPVGYTIETDFRTIDSAPLEMADFWAFMRVGVHTRTSSASE